MINSMMTIGGSLADRILCDATGAALKLPEFFPSLYQFRLRFYDKDSTGKVFQAFPNVTALSASIGLVYAEPRAGTFKLRYGTSSPTVAIDFKEPAADFQTKLAALAGSTTYGLNAVYQPTPSTWVCRFATPPAEPALVPINGIENELEPETFIRTRQFVQNDDTWVEIRLLQGPVASTNAHDQVLPNAPTVRRIRAGYTQDDGITEIKVNEIQAITVPSDFTGTYIIAYQGRQSIALSVTDGPQAIQDAMDAMYGDGIHRFNVTNPELNNAYVEFTGPFSGMAMDLLQLNISSTGLLDLTFDLDLYTTEVAEALRVNPSVAAIFEVNLHITDPNVPTDPGQDLVLFQEDVTIVRPLHWEGLEAAAPINWLYPPNPRDYIPFTMDQIIRGTITYSAPFGDGIVSNFSIAHDLNSDAINVEIRENISNGRLLKDDEYDIVFVDANGFDITIHAGPPPVNGLLAMVFSVGPIDMFLAHTHTIAQIVGLQALLDSILARLSALEALLPSLLGGGGGASVFGSTPTDEIAGFKVDSYWDLVPTNRPPLDTTFDPTKLPPAGLLLPAIHDVVDLGAFTANPTTDAILLSVAFPGLVDGQRARIYEPLFTPVGLCTFDSSSVPGNVIVSSPPNPLANGRRVQFSGGELPHAISSYTTYYVVNSTSTTFQIASAPGGDPIPLLSNGDATPHTFYTAAEVPGGLQAGVDYYMLAPTSTTFKLSLTLDGPVVDITDAGHATVFMSTVAMDPSTGGVLPPPGPLAGNVYSVAEPIVLRGTLGIRSETVDVGDFVASDGRIWYHVTRSDSIGSNSFYPNAMEKEILRVAVNENMMAPGNVFTLKFDIALQMFRHDTNIQYVLVTEIAELPQDVAPTPTGPNLFEVVWNPTPLMQQRIIVTDVLTTHHFGAQVVRKTDGTLRSNKKQYGVELAGDVIPATPVFAMRVRLIEFDTEDNVFDASGLIYYTLTNAVVGITSGSPTPPTSTALP